MRWIFVCVVAAACGIGGGHAWAVSSTTAELTLVEYCSGDQVGGTATVTGLQSGDQVLGSVEGTYPGGGGFSAGPAILTADSNGTVGPITVSSGGPLATFTAIAVLDQNKNGLQDPDEPVLTKTLTNPCQGPPMPSEKSQCKRAGFDAFGFRNQGQCVKFIESANKR